MKSAGRFEIQSPIVTGVVDTYSAKDPSSGTTVLLHVLPADCGADPKAKFLEYAPGCPGKILDSGIDQDSQRPFVVTEYPKDRKALLLWIKSLSGIPSKPAAAKPAPPPPAAASDGATRMFDPTAIFGGASPPAPVPSATPASDGATRMFDPAAIFGGGAALETPPQATPAGDGATRMFDPAAVFGGAAAAPAPAPEVQPSPPKTPQPSAAHDSKPKTDPFADLKAALARGSGSQPAPPAASEQRKGGEFTRRFELPKEFRGAPMRVDRTSQLPSSEKPGTPAHDASDKKGVFTLMMEAYANRLGTGESTPPPATASAPPTATPASDGATRMLDPSAIFGAAPSAVEKAPEKSPAEGDYPATVRIPALDDEDKKK